jgi:hypothetical protein
MPPTVTSVVRSTPLQDLLQGFAKAFPDQVFDLQLSPMLRGPSMGLPDRKLGDAFHAALSRGIRGKWIDRQFWPFVHAIKEWLKYEGVSRTQTEWSFRGSKHLRACCDLLVKGGFNNRGILEVKLIGILPDELSKDDQFQLSLYTLAAAERFRDYSNFWGAVIYVCPEVRTIRVFQFTKMDTCCHAAKQILQAA